MKRNRSAGLSSSNQPEIEDQLAGESTQSTGHDARKGRERAGIKASAGVFPNDKRTVSRVWSPGSPRGRGGGHCQLSQQFGRMILHNNSIVQTRCECSIAMICSQTRVGCSPRLLRWARGSTRLGRGRLPGEGGGLLLSQQLGHMVLRQQLLRMNECSSGASVRLGSR